MHVQRPVGDEGHPRPGRVQPGVDDGGHVADVERARRRITGQPDEVQPPGQGEHGLRDVRVARVADDATGLLAHPLPARALGCREVLLAVR